MDTQPLRRKPTILLLWLVGVAAAASILPALPGIVSQIGDAELPVSMGMIQLVSLLQTSVLIAIAVVIGTLLSPKVGLAAPAFQALINRQPVAEKLLPQLAPGLLGGVIGGVLILGIAALLTPQLPADFTNAAEQLSLPLYSRVFYGGITEEILMRWGVMTLTVWLLSKVITGKTGQIQPACFILGIVLSSLLFAAGHLPLVSILTDNITAPLLAYILIANSLFGLVAGYLYWKQGLEAAVIAHIVAHLVMYSVAG
jgi:hypothetical protein